MLRILNTRSFRSFHAIRSIGRTSVTSFSSNTTPNNASLENKISNTSKIDVKRTNDFELIQSIKSCGTDLDKAFSILDTLKIKQKNNELDDTSNVRLRAYNAILHACSVLGDLGNVLKIFKEMKSENIKPDISSYRRAIFACTKGNNWQKSINFLNEMEKQYIVPDIKCYTAVITACGKSGQWEKSLEIFNRMQMNGIRPNVIVLSSIITACEKSGKHNEGLQVFRLMKQYNVKPNVVTFASVISSCGKAGQWQLGLSIFNSMKFHQVKPNVYAFNALISCLAKAGQWQKALEIFKSMNEDIEYKDIKKDVVTYTSVISACEKGGQYERAWKLLEFMEFENIQPNEFTLNSVIKSCGNAGQIDKAIEILNSMEKRFKIKPNVFIYTSTIKACCNYGRLDKADQVLNEMIKQKVFPNVVTYSFLMSEYTKIDNPKRAVELFNSMISNEIEPNSYTLVALANAYEKLNQDEKVNDILVLMDKIYLKNEKELNLFDNTTATLNIYSFISTCMRIFSNNGKWKECIELFDGLDGSRYDGLKPDTHVYNTLITSLGNNGQLELALKYFNILLQNPKNHNNKTIYADSVSYHCILRACEQNNDMKQALKILNTMGKHNRKEVRRFTPKPEKYHYSRVIAACENHAIADYLNQYLAIDEESESLSRKEQSLKQDDCSAIKILEKAMKKGVYQHVWVNDNIIDLHGCSAAVARTVIKYFLREYRSNGTFPNSSHEVTLEEARHRDKVGDDEFLIITGHGKGTKGGGDYAVLKPVIQTLFKNENIPIETRGQNPGAFFVKAKDILKLEK